MKACAKAAGERLPLVRPPTGRALARRYCYLPVFRFFSACSLVDSPFGNSDFLRDFRSFIVRLFMYPSSLSCSASEQELIVT